MSSRCFKMRWLIVLGGSLLGALAPSARAQMLHLTGRGGTSDWGETPVMVEIKSPVAAGPYVLEASEGARIPAVVFLDDDDRLYLAAVLPAVPARKAFSLALKRPTERGEGVRRGFTSDPRAATST